MGNYIDLHCDTLSGLLELGEDASLEKNPLSVDIAGLKRAGALAQFFACFVCVSDGEWESGYQKVLRMIHRMKSEAKRCGEIAVAESYGDILENQKQKKISAVLTVEEGGILDGKIQRLEELYRYGIRLITLTWNYENCIGYPNSRNPDMMEKGLKLFGRETVERMNELGMIVDVSHLSDGGFWDCIRVSRVPVVASHSNARRLCGHPRNLTDDMLRALAEKGGVAGLNFYPDFLRQDRYAELQDIARHARYMIKTAGEELPAVGTDFDGFAVESGQSWIKGPQEMELIRDCMKKEGITERQADKIMGENALRVMREVWR